MGHLFTKMKESNGIYMQCTFNYFEMFFQQAEICCLSGPAYNHILKAEIIRPNKKISVFGVTDLKILGQEGTQILGFFGGFF